MHYVTPSYGILCGDYLYVACKIDTYFEILNKYHIPNWQEQMQAYATVSFIDFSRGDKEVSFVLFLFPETKFSRSSSCCCGCLFFLISLHALLMFFFFLSGVH